jgi:CubicO group peptidase (beta-lactamase class C family)
MRKFFFLLLLFAIVKIVPAQNAARPGFDAQRLNRIDSFINGYIKQGWCNGATAVIVQDGKMIYQKAFGFSNMEGKTAMQNNSIFRIASMTKPVVSVAAMLLYEEGKFLLDDPLSKFIPAFKDATVINKYNAADTSYTTVPATQEITIRHLLTHTSGIGYAQIGSAEANAIYYKNGINGGIGTPQFTLQQIIPKLAKLPLFNQPGQAFLYGLNTDVLGYLVEVISGMPLDKFLQQRIFLPLGMTDTYFYLPAEKQKRLVTLYKQNDNGKLEPQEKSVALNGTAVSDFPNASKGTYFSGGAGLSSTAYDYSLFCQMLINGGVYNGKRILSQHTIALMTKNQIGNFTMWGNADLSKRFGLGFGVFEEKSELTLPVGAGSYDWAGMFASHFWIDPKNKIVAVFMRNVWPTQHWDFGDRIKPVVYQALTY